MPGKTGLIFWKKCRKSRCAFVWCTILCNFFRGYQTWTILYHIQKKYFEEIAKSCHRDCW